MPAHLIPIGTPAHRDEEAALRLLAEGLPDGTTVFGNPWLFEPSGAVYELDAVVVMPHAVYVVEIKGWRGHIKGDARDWYLNEHRQNEPRRSPLQLAHKTAQILHSLLQRKSWTAGRAWTQEVIFLPHAASFDALGATGVRARVALRNEIHALLGSSQRVNELANRSLEPLDQGEVVNTLLTLFHVRPHSERLTHVAGYDIIDRLDVNDRYQEVLAEDASGLRRRLRLYRTPWNTTDAEHARFLKRATWEANILRSFARAPEDVGLLTADAPVPFDEGLVVPMEHFEGESLPAWLAHEGAKLDLPARVALWARFARALAWTHKRGVVHRQLRPELILVRGPATAHDPFQPEYRITGFDAAKRHGQHTTLALSPSQLSALEGAAPEVILGHEATEAADQFSLGLILGLLALRTPLVESTVPVAERRARLPRLRDLDPNLPQRLDEVVARMVERRPTNRFPSLEDAIRAALAAVQPDAPLAVAPPGALEAGTRLSPDYVVEARLGSGGLADVYRVRHQLTGERYAFKVARANEIAENALRCEYYALRSLQHATVVRVHDLSQVVPDRLTLRLDLLAGTTLTEAVRGHHLPAGDLAARRRLGEDLFAALDELERVGTSHNDLKPDNLMVTEAGRLVVIDFSLARGKALENKSGILPTFGGTCDWRDPSGEPPGHAADRYAAALCLFWLHTGQHPFAGRVPEPDAAADLDAVDFEPPSLRDFFERALDPVPAHRYPNARAQRDAWLAAVGAPPERAGDAPPPLFAQTPLAEAGLKARYARALAAARVRTVAELLACDDDALQDVHELGRRGVELAQALREAARAQGITPAPRPDPTTPPFFSRFAFDPAPLDALQIDSTSLDLLHRAGLATLADLASRTRVELLRLPRVNEALLQRAGEALLRLENRRALAETTETLDALWARATAALEPAQREVLEAIFGFRDPPLTQAALAERMGTQQPRVSQLQTSAIDALDRDALQPAQAALDGYLERHHGILPLQLACTQLERDLPAAALRAIGLIRLLEHLDRKAFTIHEAVTAPEVNLLTRPWVTARLLEEVAGAAHQLAKRWPPTSAVSASSSIRMAFPEYSGDPITLALALVPGLITADTGELFLTPIDEVHALRFVLDRSRDGLAHNELEAALTRAFGPARPHTPSLARARDLLEDSPWAVVGDRLVRREAAAAAPPPPRSDDARAYLQVARHVDPLVAVRERLLAGAARGSRFRLVVAPAERHLPIGQSVAEALGARAIDLADAWFTRHEDRLSSDARAARLPALRAGVGQRVNELFNELVRQHGRPEARVVVLNTGLLGTLDGLEQIRLLYDRVTGQSLGFWVVVVPGIIQDGRPLFNDRTPIWHQPGLVLPLDAPLPAGG